MCKRIGKLVLAKLLCSLVFPDKVHNHVMALDNPQSQVHAIWLATFAVSHQCARHRAWGRKADVLAILLCTLWSTDCVWEGIVCKRVQRGFTSYMIHHTVISQQWAQQQCAWERKVGLLAILLRTLWCKDDTWEWTMCKGLESGYTSYRIDHIVVSQQYVQHHAWGWYMPINKMQEGGTWVY